MYIEIIQKLEIIIETANHEIKVIKLLKFLPFLSCKL